MPLDRPQPRQRAGDVDTAVGRVGATGEGHVDAGEEPGERDQGGDPGYGPPGAAIQA